MAWAGQRWRQPRQRTHFPEEIERRLDAAETYIDDAARAIRSKGIGDYNPRFF